MEAGPLPPLGMQKSLSCQECSREMADYRRRVPHPIKVHFCRTCLNLGGGLVFFIPAGVRRAICILYFPPHCLHPAVVLLQPPLLHHLDLRDYPWALDYQRQDAQVALRGVPDRLLPHPPALLAVLFCFNISHHSLNRCALVSTCLLALGTNGGIRNVVVNKSENASNLDGCCSLTASYLFTK